MADILVYALHYEGAFNKNSLGAVSEAAKLASELGVEAHAVVVGENISDDVAKSLGKYGASKVYRVKGPEGLAQPVADALAKVAELKQRYASAGQDELDGLTVDLGEGTWFNVRPSNTEPLLRLNVEAPDDGTLARVRDEVLTLLRA